MAKAAVNSVLIDTNVLVYAAIAHSPFHSAARAILKRHYDAHDELWVSTQIIREFAAVVTHPRFAPQPLSTANVTLAARYFYRRFHVAEDNRAVNRALLQLVEQLSIQGQDVHDANLVATAMEYGIQSILTHNVSDFTRFSQLVQIVPLLSGQSSTRTP